MALLHAVTRGISDIPDDNFVKMIQAITPFVDFIQIREKSRSSKSLGLLIERLFEHDVPAEKLILNDRADIAQAFGIPRVHLTERSLSIARLQDAFPDLIFGRSFHSVSAIERELSHYEYGYLGHIFRTSEKSYPALGIEQLRTASEISREKQGKLIAIGGMDLDTVAKVAPIVDGVAVMSALFPVTNYLFDIERGRERASALRALLDQAESVNHTDKI